jgi:thioredoxin 1
MLLRQFSWKRDVLESPESVLVDFCASWSPPCRMMNRIVARIARAHKVCEVNIDTNPDLAASLGIRSIPTLMIFKDGKILANHIGFISESTLRSELGEQSSFR